LQRKIGRLERVRPIAAELIERLVDHSLEEWEGWSEEECDGA
jgi:hypothetical protein